MSLLLIEENPYAHNLESERKDRCRRLMEQDIKLAVERAFDVRRELKQLHPAALEVFIRLVS